MAHHNDYAEDYPYGTGYAGGGFYGGAYNGPGGTTGWRGGPEYTAQYPQYEPAEMHVESFAGRGPRNYTRSDERIAEDINEELTRHPGIDATDVEVQVHDGRVTLTGTVDNRDAKWMAEDAAYACSGVNDVDNQLRVARNARDPHRSYE